MQSASGPDDSNQRPLPPRSEVLHEAASIIDVDRNKSYGTPTQNFTNIAELWTTRFRHKLADGESFSASDVADAMVLLKIARNIASNSRDNYVDMAGYAGCGYEASLSEQRAREETITRQGVTINVGANTDVARVTQEMKDALRRQAASQGVK